MDTIVTRFPPSPTGNLHIGGARTALFNWLYARNMKGRFILRFEDTDTQRSTQESVDAIFDALKWLGIDWDEGPYFQSKRFDIYQSYLDKLIESGDAYYCTCTPDQIEEMRKIAMDSGGKPRYDGTCRNKGLTKSSDAVIRFKASYTGTTIIEDVIKGNIVFQNAELDDFIIQRSDGVPTYNFAVVIDDITMGVNTILRGDDHVNNTPKQILLYKALGEKLPTYGHVPMVLGSDKSRLSKRHGAMSVTAYRDMGYLPDALINYLVRLGWSHGDQEFFTRSELVEKFSIKNIGRSAGVFNPEKLLALNADHIKACSPAEIAKQVLPFFKQLDLDAKEDDYLQGVVKTLQLRSKTLPEMAQAAVFYYQDDFEYDQKAAQKFMEPSILEPLKLLIEQLKMQDDFTEKALETPFAKVMEMTGIKFGKIAQPVRIALTGKTVSPGIFEMIEALGKDKTIARMEAGARFIAQKSKE